MNDISMWLGFVFDTFAYAVNQRLIFYPLLLVLALSCVAAVAFIIRYFVRGSF